jgi:FkbM family methyltransferase
MNKLLNPLRQLYHKFRTKKKYPFWHKEYDLIFKINNPIEEFRLANWGGEKGYVLDMLNCLKTNDVFYDIGSSVGLISINAAKKLVNGMVISFEPDPENQKCLKENYKINKLHNYSLMPIAVGEQLDRLKLYTSGSNGFSPSLKKVNGIDDFIEVDVNSIDNLIFNKEIPHPTVVKIDIEGAEYIALKGMKNLLASLEKPRILFIELHPEFLSSFNTNVEDILNYMKQFDYRITEQLDRDKQILCKFEKM